jgi:hypothetical protein
VKPSNNPTGPRPGPASAQVPARLRAAGWPCEPHTPDGEGQDSWPLLAPKRNTGRTRRSGRSAIAHVEGSLGSAEALPAMRAGSTVRSPFQASRAKAGTGGFPRQHQQRLCLWILGRGERPARNSELIGCWGAGAGAGAQVPDLERATPVAAQPPPWPAGSRRGGRAALFSQGPAPPGRCLCSAHQSAPSRGAERKHASGALILVVRSHAQVSIAPKVWRAGEQREGGDSRDPA